MRFIRLFAIALLAVSTCRGATPAVDEQFIGPFATWYDLRRDFGAVGDGVADDTDALQRALDAVGTVQLGRFAIWIPAGTYRITRTLVRTGVSGIFFIGENPDTTVIRWDGPKYGGEPRVPVFNSPEWNAWNGRHPAEMLWFNGRNSRFERLTFDGAGKAASGFSFKWHDRNAKDQWASHRCSLADMIFKDMAIGIDGGGKQCWLDSEVLIQRCRFERCSQFGIGLHHFNSVDYWVWNCVFDDCRVGVSNEPKPHGGVAHVYNSLFRRSTEADFTIFHAGFFALRNNRSENSRRFVHAKNHEANGAAMELQGNLVIDPMEPDAILDETQGNVNLFDNVVISRPGAAGPVVRGGISEKGATPDADIKETFTNGWADMNVCAVGNRFTVAHPISVKGQLVELDTQVATREELLAGAWQPPIPPPLPRAKHRVFEIPSGSDGGVVQKAIDGAAAVAAADPGAWPVVHLPHGRYPIKQTLVIPAGARIYIAGDGVHMAGRPEGTLLDWVDEQAGGPVMVIEGPAKARLRDFGVITPAPWERTDKALRTAGIAGLDKVPHPNLGVSILVRGADQEGRRINLEECNPNALYGAGMQVEGLDHTQVQVIAAEGTGADQWNRRWDAMTWADPAAPYPSIRVVGGPLAYAGRIVPGVIVQGGDTGRWDVRHGGKLVVRDSWYESNWAPFHMRLSGDGHMTLDNCFEAVYTHPTLKGAGANYAFDNRHGRFAAINVTGDGSVDNPLVSYAGDCAGASILFLGGKNGDTPSPVAAAGAELLDINRFHGVHVQANPTGLPAKRFLDLLSDDRSARVQPLTPTPPHSTDLRLYRIWTWNARIGILVQASEH